MASSSTFLCHCLDAGQAVSKVHALLYICNYILCIYIYIYIHIYIYIYIYWQLTRVEYGTVGTCGS
jgi:hypothetical protein